MKNHSHSTLLTSGFAALLLLMTILGCHRPWTDKPVPENRPAPSPVVTVTPVSEGQLRRYLTNVAVGDLQSEPLPNLSDDSWHQLSPGTRVRTDENGEGWLKLRECMLIYVFQAGHMMTAPCSKAEYASGHVNCQLAGTAVYNSSCGPQAEQLIQTPTADITPQGTWFSVTYLPEQQSTFIVVFDGKVSVKPVKDIETRSLGEETSIGPGQLWVTVPDNKLHSDNDNIGGIERTVRSVAESQSVITAVVGPWLGRIIERAKQDNIADPGLQAAASPSPTVAEIASINDIDCDCKNVSAGVLTRPYQEQCLKTEENLKSQFREAKRVTGRCDPVTSGPNAKPK